MEKPPVSPKREPRRRRSAGTGRSRKRLALYRRLEAFDREITPEEELVLAGVDEAGRGALAGPVAAAAVILPVGSDLLGVNDSKQLSRAEREEAFTAILRKALAVGLSFSQPRVIDARNVLNATLEAMRRAIENLRVRPDVVILDGRDRIAELPERVIAITGGDGKSLCIAAASIVAKVARDRVMARLHREHPAYNFLSNKGYGTREHIDAILRNGMSAVHRKSYRIGPVAELPSLF